MNKDLNKLAKEVFEANKAKGFHEEEHSDEHYLCLVISELMEAVEADRKNKKADLKTFEELMSGVKDKHYDIMYAKCFDSFIKDTVEDELADACIRLLDLAGLKGYIKPLTCDPHAKESLFAVAVLNFKDKSFSEIIYETIKTIFSDKELFHKIKQCMLSIEWICKHLDIDLCKHVELKLEYNSLRPHLHGKRY